jgi:hypothetical protein
MCQEIKNDDIFFYIVLVRKSTFKELNVHSVSNKIDIQHKKNRLALCLTIHLIIKLIKISYILL